MISPMSWWGWIIVFWTIWVGFLFGVWWTASNIDRKENQREQ
jgi:hypothetical protein